MSGARRVRLDREKQPEKNSGSGQQDERSGGRPAHSVAIDDRVDGEHERAGHRDGPCDVQPSRCRRHACAGEHQPRQKDDGDPDWDVDEEDPTPVESLGEDPADKDADRAAAGGNETKDPHRLRPLRRLGEEADDERERDRRDDGTADALHRPRTDQARLRRDEPAAKRSEGEQRDADEEQPPVPKEVAQTPREEEKPAEGE